MILHVVRMAREAGPETKLGSEVTPPRARAVVKLVLGVWGFGLAMGLQRGIQGIAQPQRCRGEDL